jgi:hypothetical protein
MSRPVCGRPIVNGGLSVPCQRERMKGKQQCRWHWLLKQPADVQQRHARARHALHQGEDVARVPKDEWPEGERWCSGCQSFVPLFYTTGSRCRSCASTAAHGQRIEKLYGITPEDYDRLFAWQGGRCYVCQRQPRTLRLAVDHDHRTGQVRGLLCANNENGCNRAVVANLEAAVDGGLSAAKRAVIYLADPPFAQMLRGDRVSWLGFVATEDARLAREADQRSLQVSEPPPF